MFSRMMRAARVLSVETDTAYALRVRNFSARTEPGTVQYTQLGSRSSLALLASPQDGPLSVATVSLPLVYYSGDYHSPVLR